MWTVLAFVSALCLGFYDISKKIALRENRVVDVLTISVCVSSLFLSIPLIFSRLCPEMMLGTHFYVPSLDGTAHAYTILKSIIVLSSWFFGYISLKHLPISVVSPMQATRPMWTLVGALLLFNERLNGWQWVGILLAIGSIFVFSFRRKTISNALSTNTNNKYYYICLAFAIISGACSGLYDKYLMRQYDHNAVQVYYTFYQAIMMLIAWAVFNRKNIRLKIADLRSIKKNRRDCVNQPILNCVRQCLYARSARPRFDDCCRQYHSSRGCRNRFCIRPAIPQRTRLGAQAMLHGRNPCGPGLSGDGFDVIFTPALSPVLPSYPGEDQ